MVGEETLRRKDGANSANARAGGTTQQKWIPIIERFIEESSRKCIELSNISLLTFNSIAQPWVNLCGVMNILENELCSNKSTSTITAVKIPPIIIHEKVSNF